jgi:hypothetical protein
MGSCRENSNQSCGVCRSVLFHPVLCHCVLCHSVLCQPVLCHPILCHPVLCHPVLCLIARWWHSKHGHSCHFAVIQFNHLLALFPLQVWPEASRLARPRTRNATPVRTGISMESHLHAVRAARPAAFHPIWVSHDTVFTVSSMWQVERPFLEHCSWDCCLYCVHQSVCAVSTSLSVLYPPVCAVSTSLSVLCPPVCLCCIHQSVCAVSTSLSVLYPPVCLCCVHQSVCAVSTSLSV